MTHGVAQGELLDALHEGTSQVLGVRRAGVERVRRAIGLDQLPIRVVDVDAIRDSVEDSIKPRGARRCFATRRLRRREEVGTVERQTDAIGYQLQQRDISAREPARRRRADMYDTN